MEIIDEIEAHPRGAYTGSMGWIDSSRDASFNVAIRTISVNEGDEWGQIGLGSGIVADSDMRSEWDECLEKGKFLWRSEEHTSELQSLMRISYAVFCLKKKKKNKIRLVLHDNQYKKKIYNSYRYDMTRQNDEIK